MAGEGTALVTDGSPRSMTAEAESAIDTRLMSMLEEQGHDTGEFGGDTGGAEETTDDGAPDDHDSAEDVDDPDESAEDDAEFEDEDDDELDEDDDDDPESTSSPRRAPSRQERQRAFRIARAHGLDAAKIQAEIAGDDDAVRFWADMPDADGETAGTTEKKAPTTAQPSAVAKVIDRLDELAGKIGKDEVAALKGVLSDVDTAQRQAVQSVYAQLEPVRRQSAIMGLQLAGNDRLADAKVIKAVNEKIDAMIQSPDEVARFAGNYEGLVAEAVQSVTGRMDARQARINDNAKSTEKRRGQPPGARGRQRRQSVKPLDGEALRDKVLELAVKGVGGSGPMTSAQATAYLRDQGLIEGGGPAQSVSTSKGGRRTRRPDRPFPADDS